MHVARRYLSALVLTAALATTGSVVAARTPQDVQVRVYDRDHKDYHDWNESEERAYKHYLEERHEQYRKYDKLKEKGTEGLLELAAQPFRLASSDVKFIDS